MLDPITGKTAFSGPGHEQIARKNRLLNRQADE